MHFEVSGVRAAPPASAVQNGMYTTQMIDEAAVWPGPSRPVAQTNSTGDTVSFATAQMRVDIDRGTLAATVYDTTQAPPLLLTRYSYANLGGAIKTLNMAQSFAQNIYGLGEHYMEPFGSADGDFFGKAFMLSPDVPFGNAAWPLTIDGQWKGMSELAYFPIMYVAGPGTQNYATFCDNVHRKEWVFTADPWALNMWGTHVRWYTMRGASLPELRTTYMSLVGRPLVPPKRYFGLHQSIFGYRSWDHANVDIDLLTAPAVAAQRFPVDAIVFDIYWFGGKFYGDQSEQAARASVMGSLQWDPVAFPDPVRNVAALRYAEIPKIQPG